MLFRSASIAVLACAASASAKPQPYKLAVMAVPGLSLSRRDTLGYQPEEQGCNGSGDTCETVCGNAADSGWTQCASNDAAIHCFNPKEGQSCCSDGTGNSCESGYYCTHDHQLETWCCPDSMDLAECAAAYSVTGGLELPESTTSSASSTSTSSTLSTSTTSKEETTTSSTPTPTIEAVTTTTPETTTVCSTSKWHGHNSTATHHSTTVGQTTSAWVIPSSSAAGSPASSDSTPAPEASQTTGAASASGVSLALLVAAAGFVALF